MFKLNFTTKIYHSKLVQKNIGSGDVILEDNTKKKKKKKHDKYGSNWRRRKSLVNRFTRKRQAEFTGSTMRRKGFEHVITTGKL